ncbi:MAG: hypothetical protein OEZ48_12695 [Candidatus Bathyarchaeota archaeon]|nr:hypothetical protein [Candidatus Bathyarchaeota archaeon]MDH5688703.1 hypothetical protein [Candidatus Bathyarchaeota archaeon]
MELKVGEIFECPEGHEATIVWISEDKKVVAVRCPQKHLRKVVKVASARAKEREIYVKNMVFLIEIQ